MSWTEMSPELALATGMVMGTLALGAAQAEGSAVIAGVAPALDVNGNYTNQFVVALRSGTEVIITVTLPEEDDTEDLPDDIDWD